jgi:acyl-CoA reductase-like NAD-dependent aldehyde dehydrogenase
MTGPLEEALRRVESLPREEQDAVAAQIMDALDDEDAWARSFRQRPELLRSLAREAMEEHRRGETRPIDELLG